MFIITKDIQNKIIIIETQDIDVAISNIFRYGIFEQLHKYVKIDKNIKATYKIHKKFYFLDNFLGFLGAETPAQKKSCMYFETAQDAQKFMDDFITPKIILNKLVGK